MSAITQYDSATSPSKADVGAAIAHNPQLGAWQGYVPAWGGPSLGGWTPEGAAAVLESGLGFLPLLVPANGDPASCPQTAEGWDQAVAFARNFLAQAEALIAVDDTAEGDQPQTVELTVLGIDVESSWSAGNPDGWKAVCGQFVMACNRAGVHSIVYGTPSFLASLGSLPNGDGDNALNQVPYAAYFGEWPNGANPPVGGAPATAEGVPGIADTEWGIGTRIWQYQGGHPGAGLAFDIDASVSDSSFPYVRLPAATPIEPAPPPTPPPSPTPASQAEAALTEAMTALDAAEASVTQSKAAITAALNALTA